MAERHAVFATCRIDGDPVTFRVGQPVDWHRAQARWERLYPLIVTERNPLDRALSYAIPKGRVRHSRRWYGADFLEVRAVDRHGRGLGSERHSTAIHVPYRAFKRGKV